MTPSLFRYELQVRGYELDSFGHVNNAVYLQYLEQARWEIIRHLGLMDFFIETGSFLVVTETRIKYLHELHIFDDLLIETTMHREGFFILFKQTIFTKNEHKKMAKGTIKCLFVNKQREPQEIPETIAFYITPND